MTWLALRLTAPNTTQTAFHTSRIIPSFTLPLAATLAAFTIALQSASVMAAAPSPSPSPATATAQNTESAASNKNTAPPQITIQAGIHQITAEVAATAVARETGLMHRKSMAPNHGMLFIFEQKEPHCFWMRNTFIPLSIAFIADDGSIVNIEDMQPQSEKSHCAAGRVRYALEMNQGWFKQKGIKAGAKLGSIPQ